MSNTIRVTEEQFDDAVLKLLKKYGDDVYEILMEITKKTSRETAREIKANAPVLSGDYAKGWSHKANKNGYSKYSETVYNRTDWQLTHLLEKPHDTGGGGHYPNPQYGHDHTGVIERIEQKHIDDYISEVMRKL